MKRARAKSVPAAAAVVAVLTKAAALVANTKAAIDFAVSEQV